jgi:hypothetical protein
MTRTLAAILVAPLAVVPVLAIVFAWWAIARGGTAGLAGIIVPAVVVAYPLLILFGLPVHLALVQQRCTRWTHYGLAGALLGAVPVIGYCLVAIAFEAKFELAAMGGALARNLEWGAIGVVVFGACSLAVALAFRAIALGGPLTASPSGSR